LEEGLARCSGGYAASIAGALITGIEARQKAIEALREEAWGINLARGQSSTKIVWLRRRRA
jgi:hypothetical protein